MWQELPPELNVSRGKAGTSGSAASFKASRAYTPSGSQVAVRTRTSAEEAWATSNFRIPRGKFTCCEFSSTAPTPQTRTSSAEKATVNQMHNLCICFEMDSCSFLEQAAGYLVARQHHRDNAIRASITWCARKGDCCTHSYLGSASSYSLGPNPTR